MNVAHANLIYNIKNGFLEKEKEQIMKAYCDGFDELLPFHENEYYNQTYNQQ
jgi:hypothetical protein